MAQFKDVSSDAGLKSLNDFFSTRSYVDGFKPSGADAALVLRVSPAVDRNRFPHVARWFSHIISFTSCQRNKWGGAGASASNAEEKKSNKPASPVKSPAKSPAKKPAKKEDSDSDDDAGFSLEDDDGDAAALIAKKNKEAEAKKAAEKAAADGKKKKEVIAKSTLILDVKPNESETDLKKMEADIRAITKEGLLWGECQQIPVAYGIKKLRIIAVIVDDLISVDDLQEEIEGFEDVQSTDIHAFNKL